MAETRDQEAARANAAARQGAGPNLARRFYVNADSVLAQDGYAIALDGKFIKTPGRNPLLVPVSGIADVIAAEWRAQGETIDPATMPMTRLVNSAIDGVAGAQAEVAADIVKYAGSDLICYRADFPIKLAELQRSSWNPLLDWARTTHRWRFNIAMGVIHVEQPPETLRSLAAAVAGRNAFALAGLHSMTTLMGSVLLALAVADQAWQPEAAWAAAHVDEDFQISQWGEDAEAARRRAYRWRDMQAAAMLTRLGSQA